MGQVVTTQPGAKRLGGGADRPRAMGDDDARGRGPSAARDHRDAVPSRPAREPPDRRRRDRVRAALGRPGARALWISGDTVLYEGVREVAEHVDVGTAIVHLGGVRFPVSGPLRYTMTAEDARRALRPARPAGDRPDPLRGLEALPPGPLGGRARVHGARRWPSACTGWRPARRPISPCERGRPADADDAGGVGRGGARRDRDRRGARAVGAVGRPSARRQQGRALPPFLGPAGAAARGARALGGPPGDGARTSASTRSPIRAGACTSC